MGAYVPDWRPEVHDGTAGGSAYGTFSRSPTVDTSRSSSTGFSITGPISGSVMLGQLVKTGDKNNRSYSVIC
jgi:hypothetical protein